MEVFRKVFKGGVLRISKGLCVFKGGSKVYLVDFLIFSCASGRSCKGF